MTEGKGHHALVGAIIYVREYHYLNYAVSYSYVHTSDIHDVANQKSHVVSNQESR